MQKQKTKSGSELNSISQFSCIDSTKQSQISRLRKKNNCLILSQTVSSHIEYDSSFKSKEIVSSGSEVNCGLSQYKVEISRLESEIKYYQLEYDNFINNSEYKAIKHSIDDIKEKIKQTKKKNDSIRKHIIEISNENKEIKVLLNKSKEKKVNKTITPFPTTDNYPKSKVNNLFD